MTSSGPTLRVVSPDATPDEVAAIVAAVTQVDRARRAAAGAEGHAHDPQQLAHWRESTRLTARRAAMTRGPWRLSGRLARRTRA